MGLGQQIFRMYELEMSNISRIYINILKLPPNEWDMDLPVKEENQFFK